jgi:SPP1 family predicted phage head-tail adaptor
MAISRLNPGKCRHQFAVKYNSASTSLDSIGRDVVVEATLATIKAEFKTLTGEERTQANQQYGTATHELATWFFPGVTTEMWLEGFNGKRYNIVDINNIEEQNSWLYMVLASESS